MTPFLSAASKGKEKVMEVLIENGCNVHEKSGVGKSFMRLLLMGCMYICSLGMHWHMRVLEVIWKLLNG